jgi:hypothetical protein
MTKQITGMNLKLMRVHVGLKAIDVAIALGWSPSKLSLVENGRIKVDQDAMVTIQETVKRLSQKDY